MKKQWAKVFVNLALPVSMIACSAYAASNSNQCIDIEDNSARLSCYDNASQIQKSAQNGLETEASAVDERIAKESNQFLEWFSITPHRPNYVLPISHNLSPDYSIYNESGDRFSDTEVKLQLSIKTPLLVNTFRDSTVWFAYTQTSYWQLYADSEESSPFRETNHEPEFLWSVPVNFDVLGLNARLMSVGVNHQSNGRSKPLSRSWNRLTAAIILEKRYVVLSAKTWVRIDGESDDDNPNIEDFMGRIQLGAVYTRGDQTISMGLKNNLRSDNRSGLEFNWSRPLEPESVLPYRQTVNSHFDQDRAFPAVCVI